MKKIVLLLLIVILTISVVTADSYDLTAAEVSPGVFEEGGYYFPHTLYLGTDEDPSFEVSAIYFGDNSDLTYLMYYNGDELSYPIYIRGTDSSSSGKGIWANMDGGYGVYGKTADTSNQYAGVVGYASEGAYGVYGMDSSGSSVGVKAYSSYKEFATSGYGDYGLYVPGADYYGIYAKSDYIGGYFEGDTYGISTPDKAKVGSCSGCDIAEHFLNLENLEAGDVVVLDSSATRGVKKTTKPYNKLAAGIVSTDPTITMGLEEGVPIALSGVVPTKVVGKVEIGDLLTTSSVAGHAMACDDYDKCKGAIIGKAMEENKEGFVLALVMLG